MKIYNNISLSRYRAGCCFHARRMHPSRGVRGRSGAEQGGRQEVGWSRQNMQNHSGFVRHVNSFLFYYYTTN